MAPRQKFDITKKIEILQEIERNAVSKVLNKVQIAQKFGISPSTLSTIEKNKEKIYAGVAEGTLRPKTKKIRGAKFSDLEEELFQWYKKNQIQ